MPPNPAFGVTLGERALRCLAPRARTAAAVAPLAAGQAPRRASASKPKITLKMSWPDVGQCQQLARAGRRRRRRRRGPGAARDGTRNRHEEVGRSAAQSLSLTAMLARLAWLPYKVHDTVDTHHTPRKIVENLD